MSRTSSLETIGISLKQNGHLNLKVPRRFRAGVPDVADGAPPANERVMPMLE